jgi:hypothetical protein
MSVALRVLLAVFIIVASRALVSVAHAFDWYPEEQLARLLLASTNVFYVEWVSGVDGDELAKIADALDALKAASDKPSRLSAYNHFVSICADHIGIISPFIEPLKNMFLA